MFSEDAAEPRVWRERRGKESKTVTTLDSASEAGRDSTPSGDKRERQGHW